MCLPCDTELQAWARKLSVIPRSGPCPLTGIGKLTGPGEAGSGKELSASLSLLSAHPLSLLVARRSSNRNSAALYRCAISVIPDELACQPVGKPNPPQHAPQDTS